MYMYIYICIIQLTETGLSCHNPLLHTHVRISCLMSICSCVFVSVCLCLHSTYTNVFTCMPTEMMLMYI